MVLGAAGQFRGHRLCPSSMEMVAPPPSPLYWIWLLLVEEIEYSRSNWIRHLLPSRVGDFRPFLSDPGHSCPAAQRPQVPARCCCCVHTSACSCVRKHSTDILSSLTETLFLQKKLSQAAKLIAHQLLGDGAAQRQSACRAPRLHLQRSHMMFKFKRDFLNIFFFELSAFILPFREKSYGF